MVENVLR